MKSSISGQPRPTLLASWPDRYGRSEIPATVKVVWDRPKVEFITQALPRAAHQIGLGAAALAASEAIGPAYRSTGALAADVRVPNEVTELSGTVGSDLVYARIQDQGGVIRPRVADRLLIHSDRRYSEREGAISPGTDVAGRFQTREVVASADEVTIPAKHYLDAAPPAYIAATQIALRQGFPG